MKPSETFGMPVLGRIVTRRIELESSEGDPFVLGPATYDYIAVHSVGDEGKRRIYVCDAWNEPGTVQLVPGDFVETVQSADEPCDACVLCRDEDTATGDEPRWIPDPEGGRAFPEHPERGCVHWSVHGRAL